MLVVEPSHIAKYSQCPRRALMSWNLTKPDNLNFESTVLQHIIQAAYLYCSRHASIPSWRRITYWADLYYQKDATDPTVPRPKEYKSAISLLNTLHGWYHNYFVHDIGSIESIINVPIYLELGHSVVYKDVVPVVSIGETVKLADFQQIDKCKNLGIIDIYNDLAVHIRTWGFHQAAAQLPSHYVRFFIMPESIRPIEIKVTKDLLENAAKISKHILTGIKDRVFYPSFSEQCMRCPFKTGCSI